MKEKILFVLGGSLDVGGAENQLLALIPELLKSGLEVAVLCLRPPGIRGDRVKQMGVPVFAPPEFTNRGRGIVRKLAGLLGGVLAVWRCVRRERPDIAHFILPHAYLVGGLALIAAGSPRCVMSRRGMNRYLQSRPMTRWIERKLHQRMHILLGNSCQVARELVFEGAPSERVGVIYNGLADHRFEALPSCAEAREQLGLPQNTLILIKVANLWPYKGHVDIIEALAGIDLPGDWRLLIVGRDEGAGSGVRQEIARRELDGHVIIVGERDDVPLLLAAADIAVCASHEEGFSNAVLEYMAAGLASVVTDVGGNREAVADAGIVVPADDVPSLRKAIITLLDSDTRAGLAARARQRARCFSMPRCAFEYEKLYRYLLSRGTLPPHLKASTLCADGSQVSNEQVGWS